MVSKGAAARNKGKNGEREVALQFIGAMRQVEAHLGYKYYGENGEINQDLPSCKVERNLQQSIAGGHDIVGIPFYAPEVKRVETPQINAWWQQCLEQANHAKLRPVLIWKMARQDWKCRTYFKHFSGSWVVADCNFMDWLKEFQVEYYNHLKENPLC